MNFIVNNDIRLAYEEKGYGKHSIVFIHGWTCNHDHFKAQMKTLGESYRVVAVDLRGHGQSDKAADEYTLDLFAADIAWICKELELSRPLLVGHSMGGAVALETAVYYPELISGIILIDTLLLPDEALLASVTSMHKSLLTEDFSLAIEKIASLLNLPQDNEELRAEILTGMKATSPEVAISAFEHHILNYDATASMRACQVPAAYIRSLGFMASLDRLKAVWPGLLTANTLGSGHFSMLEVPEQIDGMIKRFCSLLWCDGASGVTESRGDDEVLQRDPRSQDGPVLFTDVLEELLTQSSGSSLLRSFEASEAKELD